MYTDLDPIDFQILGLLQEDGRASHSAVAEAVGLSQPAVHERVKKLEKRGVIRGYTAIVDPEALGLHVLALINIRMNDFAAHKIAEAIRNIPGVMDVLNVAGEDCLVVKVRVHSPTEIERILKQIWESGPVAATRTTVAFSAFKESLSLPLPQDYADEEERLSA